MLTDKQSTIFKKGAGLEKYTIPKTSDISFQSFSNILEGTDFFFNDHKKQYSVYSDYFQIPLHKRIIVYKPIDLLDQNMVENVPSLMLC